MVESFPPLIQEYKVSRFAPVFKTTQPLTSPKGTKNHALGTLGLHRFIGLSGKVSTQPCYRSCLLANPKRGKAAGLNLHPDNKAVQSITLSLSSPFV